MNGNEWSIELNLNTLVSSSLVPTLETYFVIGEVLEVVLAFSEYKCKLVA
jgi:hypothetical protein